MKKLVFDRSNKQVKINVYINLITALFVLVFYMIPTFSGFEGMILPFIVVFFLYFAIFGVGFQYVYYQLIYAIFIVGFVCFIILLIYSIKFLKGTKTIKVKKYFILLFMQLLFTIGLLYFGIDVFRDGTGIVSDSPIELPRIHYPYNMILAILSIVLTIMQIIHFYCVTKKSLKIIS